MSHGFASERTERQVKRGRTCEGAVPLPDHACRVNGPEHYQRHVITVYAHSNCWLEEATAQDVYPLASSEHERFNYERRAQHG
jgi:hypothetical protein